MKEASMTPEPPDIDKIRATITENLIMMQQLAQVQAMQGGQLFNHEKQIADHRRMMEESDRRHAQSMADFDARLEATMRLHSEALAEHDRRMAEHDRRMAELDRKMAEQAERGEASDRRLDALIAVVDGIIRDGKRPPQ